MAKSIDFESALGELESVVTELDGELKLDKALELFEKGMKLSKECEQFLKTAQQKVEILKRNSDGSITTEDFAGEDSANSEETTKAKTSFIARETVTIETETVVDDDSRETRAKRSRTEERGDDGQLSLEI